MHYTVEVVRVKYTWRGHLKRINQWVEHFSTFPAASARQDQLIAQGLVTTLIDWGTDPGPMPEPAKPGVDIPEDEDFDKVMWATKLNKEAARGNSVPF